MLEATSTGEPALRNNHCNGIDGTTRKLSLTKNGQVALIGFAEDCKKNFNDISDAKFGAGFILPATASVFHGLLWIIFVFLPAPDRDGEPCRNESQQDVSSQAPTTPLPTMQAPSQALKESSSPTPMPTPVIQA